MKKVLGRLLDELTTSGAQVEDGRNVRVTNQRGTTDSEEQPTHVIRDGVVVIQKAAVLKDGTVI